MNPAAGNVAPNPIDDPHMRVANHEDLLPADRDVIETSLMENPDDFAAWEAEVRHLDAEPAPTPEDTRNKEKLADLFDRPAFSGTTEASTQPEASDGPQLDEVGQLLKTLGAKAESSQRIFDFVHDRNEIIATAEFQSVRRQLKLSEAEAYDVYTNQVLGPQQKERWTALDDDLTKLAGILQKHPNQWRFVLHAGEHREDNVATAHGNLTSAEGETTARQEAARLAGVTRLVQEKDGEDAHGNTLYKTVHRDNAPLGSLERADANIQARDAQTAEEISQHHHNVTQRAADNFRGFMRILESKGAVPDIGGEKLVADFVQDFEARQGRNINEAVRELNEGQTFRAYLEAGTNPTDRAKAEQPMWRDIAFTGRAAQELQSQLQQMRANGMSTAHSHYRELNAKFAEVQRAHISSWQRWQNVRQQRAAEAAPLANPDFQGRRPVFVAGDQEKGLYVATGPGSTAVVVYPDYSMRHVAISPAGVPTLGDRFKLDGSEWKDSEPVELTYEPAAPARTSTSGIVGHLSLQATGMARAAGIDKSRVDNRDIPALSTAYAEANFQVGMHPANHDVLKRAYDTTRLLEQRVNEQIETLEAIDPADITPTQQASLQTMLRSRGVLQARAKYLEHGSKDNTSTMGHDASVTFKGTMYDEQRPRRWRVALTGDAWKLSNSGAFVQAFRADGTRI